MKSFECTSPIPVLSRIEEFVLRLGGTVIASVIPREGRATLWFSLRGKNRKKGLTRFVQHLPNTDLQSLV